MFKFIYLFPILFFVLPSCSSEVEPANLDEGTDEVIIQIDEADQVCKVDSDCTQVLTQCACDCGSPLNKLYLQKYIALQEQTCKDYDGPVCKMSCTQVPKCVNNLCILAEA